MTGKLYWRYKKDGKWTWKPYVNPKGGRPSHLDKLIEKVRLQEEE